MGACGSREPAPYLREYFAILGQSVSAAADVDPMEMLMNPEAIKKIQEKAADEHKKLTPVIQSSFDHHDTKKTGYLDPDEAKVFCEHYVKLFIDFHEKHDIKLMKTQMAKSQKMTQGIMGAFGGGSREEKREMDKMLAAQLKETENQLKAKLKAKRDQYRSNEAECNAMAFKFLDVSGDGKVQKADVVLALTPDTEMYNNVHEALGLIDREELMMKEVAASMAGLMGGGDGAQDCAQQ